MKGKGGHLGEREERWKEKQKGGIWEGGGSLVIVMRTKRYIQHESSGSRAA